MAASTNIIDILEAAPIIAAVRDEAGLAKVLETPAQVVFLLHSTLTTVKDQVARIKAGGKICFIHLEMIAGLSKDQVALDFLRSEAAPDGIITTKPNLVQPAKDLGLYTVQRLFILDSQSIQTGLKMIQHNHTDLIEIMPGIIPKVVTEIKKHSRIPVIAGGMINTKEEIIELLKVGVIAVSTSDTELWEL